MADHRELKLQDLHRPSRWPIINNTGQELTIGQFVFLGVNENSNNFVPVSRLANTDEVDIGYVDIGIANGNSGTVVTKDRIRVDTSAFIVQKGVRIVNTAGVFTFIESTDGSHEVGRIVTSDVIGTIMLDTISVKIAVLTPGAKKLTDLDDVALTNVQTGDVLVSDANQIFKNEQPTIATITGPDADGAIEITGGDGVEHDFSEGHKLYSKDGSNSVVGPGGVFTQRKNLVFNGAIVNDTTVQIPGDPDPVMVNATEVSTFNALISSNSDSGVVDPFISETLGNQPVGIFKKLKGTANEVTIESTQTNNFNPLITVSSPELRSGLDSLIGTDGTIESITNVEFTSLKNNQIQEFDAEAAKWVNKDVPTGSPTTIEGLTDVHIEDRVGGKTIISEIDIAFVDIEGANDATNIFGLDTSDGLLFVAPTGDDAIDTVHIGIARNRTDVTDYTILDNELLVELEFASGNPSLDDMYARVVTAFNDTSFPDGVRTIDSKDYHRVGDWTNPTNPRHIPGATATGSQTFSIPNAGATSTDTGVFRYVVASPLGHFTQSFSISNITVNPSNQNAALTSLLNEIVVGMNADVFFSPIYTASSSGATLTITANSEGAAANGTVSCRILDTGGINVTFTVQPSAATINVNGGQDSDNSETTLRWTNTGNSHPITKPTPFGGTTLYFKQGGFDWTDTDFAIRNLIDVAENTEEFPQMLIRPNAISDFNYTDVRIQNLDVINRAEKFKQGTLLQYANGNVLWEYCGLANDGTVDSNGRANFFQEPTDGMFLSYNFRGGLDPQWTARFPLMADVASVVNEEIGSVLISPDGTGFQAENATPSEMFLELGNTSNQTFGILPLLSPRYDSTYSFTTGNDFFAVRATGSYEFQLALTKNFQQASGTTGDVTENISFFVTKNGSNTVVDGNEWAHPANSTNNSLVAVSGNFQVPRNDGTFPNSLGASIASCSPLIIDLSAGDTVQIKFIFVNPGVIGLTMSNGQQGKSWCRVKRVQ